MIRLIIKKEGYPSITRKLVTLIMCIAMLVSVACASAEVDREKVYGGYAEPVTLTITKPVVPSSNFGNPDDN